VITLFRLRCVIAEEVYALPTFDIGNP